MTGCIQYQAVNTSCFIQPVELASQFIFKEHLDSRPKIINRCPEVYRGPLNRIEANRKYVGITLIPQKNAGFFKMKDSN
ncbi:MAG: hypothetical protein PHY99_04605 [Bacteroidales bacterium]|nr:hypothetical protein [Bacteroidales bacterium]